MEKIILDLCGGTGSWSKPYKKAGYDVRLITLPGYDVRNYKPPNNVYGILAAIPCDDFAVSGARWFKEKDKNGSTIKSLGVAISCLNIIAKCQPKFWTVEQPVSRLSRLLGKPKLIFNPCDYGNPYTKKTCLWGIFNIPTKSPVKPTEGSKMHLIAPGEKRKEIRAITPIGFAKAFFKANP